MNFKLNSNISYLALALFLCINLVDLKSARAQQGLYFRAGAGYSFPSAKTGFSDADPNGLTGILPSTDITVGEDGSTANVKSLSGSLGAGLKATAVIGYMFNEYIGAELGLNYFRGKETLIGRLQAPDFRSQAVAYIRGADISPAIVITPGFEGINPYARLGLLLTVAGDLTIDTSIDRINVDNNGTDLLTRAQSEVMARFSAGYVAALGVLYPINDKISVFGEFEIKSFTIRSKEAEIKSFQTVGVNNGQSDLIRGGQLEDLSISQKKFIFEDEFSSSLDTNDPDQPTVIPTEEVNASGAGFNFGIRVNL